MTRPLLEVRDLSIDFASGDTLTHAVHTASFSVEKGETLALVGESGSGKTVTAMSVLQLLPPAARYPSGSIRLKGEEMLGAGKQTLRRARGDTVGVVFQEPMTSLNPLHTVHRQIAEVIATHRPMNRQRIRERTIELLHLVGIAEAEKRLGAFPHELSGGQRQRVMIAIALACRPQVLIADEPTTALDVTVQMQVLSLIRELCDAFDMGVLFITHDLGVVSELADRVAVMYGGKIAETGPVEELFRNPLHPYTGGLMGCVPDPAAGHRRFRTIPGQAPKPGEVPEGCKFAPRCAHVQPACRAGAVPAVAAGARHAAHCHFPLFRGEP